MRNFKKVLLSILFVFTAILAVACGNNNSSKSNDSGSNATLNGKITAVGSTALQPLVEQAAKDFQGKNSGVTINVQGGGSGTGLSQVAQGAVTIGNSDIFAEAKAGVDTSKILDHKVAVVGMAPVVNPDVNVKNISMAQLRDIFLGEIKNWKEVGGKDEKITVINRAEGSGTRATFENAVLKGEKAVKSQEQDSSGTVQKIVSTTPGAISYLAFSYLVKGLQPLSVDHVEPTDANVTTDKWKIWSYEHMYTAKKPTTAATVFIKYIADHKSLIKKLGYIDINSMKVEKDAKGTVTTK